jgi:hypothetical protein
MWEDNIKTDVKEVWRDRKNLTHVPQDSNKWLDFVKKVTKISGSVKCGEFVDELNKGWQHF